MFVKWTGVKCDVEKKVLVSYSHLSSDVAPTRSFICCSSVFLKVNETSTPDCLCFIINVRSSNTALPQPGEARLEVPLSPYCWQFVLSYAITSRLNYSPNMLQPDTSYIVETAHSDHFEWGAIRPSQIQPYSEDDHVNLCTSTVEYLWWKSFAKFFGEVHRRSCMHFYSVPLLLAGLDLRWWLLISLTGWEGLCLPYSHVVRKAPASKKGCQSFRST